MSSVVTKFTDLHDACLRELFSKFTAEEKFKFESVQKSWQRLIHEGTEEINPWKLSNLFRHSTTSTDTSGSDQKRLTCIQLTQRAKLFWRKCPNVVTIALEAYWHRR